MASGNELGLIIHPLRFSIPREYEIWKQFRKYPEKQAEKCMKAMQAMGYDLNYKGLYEMTVRIVQVQIQIHGLLICQTLLETICGKQPLQIQT